jgi:FXSXX-COOH protein
MTTSTLPPLRVDARTGLNESDHIPDVVPLQTARASIRMAGLADIPGIARITQEGPPPAVIEAAVMSRATRLLLTHVAFEHGALWVEQVDGGPIIRAVTAIPAGQLAASHSGLREVIRRLGRPAAPPPVPVFGFGEVLLAELKLVRPVWLLIEISKASQNRTGDPALLGAALQWARENSEPARDPVMVLTDTMPERRAAESLGFVERRTWGRRWPWWLGVAAPVARSSDA